MTRSRKACEYCCEDHWDSENIGKNQISVEIYPEAGFIGVTGFLQNINEEMDEVTFNIPMNYCPVCGRKLVN